MRTEMRGLLLAAAAMFVGHAGCIAADSSSGVPQALASANSSLYLKVQLNHLVKPSKLKPGDIVEGTLARDVYSLDRELFAAGSRVRLTVDHTEVRRKALNDHWPWIVRAFTPRHEKYPAFTLAIVSGAAGEDTLQVSLVSISQTREVRANAKKKAARKNTSVIEVGGPGVATESRRPATPTMVLEAFRDAEPSSIKDKETNLGAADLSGLETLPAGTACKILLLEDVSASKSKPGDLIAGRLLDPVFLNSLIVLPAGTLIEGKVVKNTPPRWGSRAGSLSLTFTGLTLPGGNRIPIAASLTGAELDRRSHTKMSAEGQLHGEHPGMAWMAINIGVTAGISKEADDATQLIVEALISTATDASTAGMARIVSSCISTIFMVSRHGRDVVLPRFTELNIALDRPLFVSKSVSGKLASPVPSIGN